MKGQREGYKKGDSKSLNKRGGAGMQKKKVQKHLRKGRTGHKKDGKEHTKRG